MSDTFDWDFINFKAAQGIPIEYAITYEMEYKYAEQLEEQKRLERQNKGNKSKKKGKKK